MSELNERRYNSHIGCSYIGPIQLSKQDYADAEESLYDLLDSQIRDKPEPKPTTEQILKVANDWHEQNEAYKREFFNNGCKVKYKEIDNATK